MKGKMEKIIIQNETDLPIVDVLPFVASVLRDGRVSDNGKAYCYGSVWRDFFVDGQHLMVAAIRNEKSDRFVVYYHPSK